jgi:hypothetical protein
MLRLTRMLTDGELSLAAKASHYQHVRLTENVLKAEGDPLDSGVSELIREIRNMRQPGLESGDRRPIAVPILARSHWTLLVVSEREVCLFDSIRSSEDTRFPPFLANNAEFKALREEFNLNLTRAGGRLQTFAPNACGIFVLEAIGVVDAAQRERTDAGNDRFVFKTALQRFANDFSARSLTEQVAFNRERRIKTMLLFLSAVEKWSAEVSGSKRPVESESALARARATEEALAEVPAAADVRQPFVPQRMLPRAVIAPLTQTAAADRHDTRALTVSDA